jgi:hypothetical protein
MLSSMYLAKFYNRIFVSQIGYRHLSPVSPPASTSSETLPTLQVLPKRIIVRVFLVCC